MVAVDRVSCDVEDLALADLPAELAALLGAARIEPDDRVGQRAVLRIHRDHRFAERAEGDRSDGVGAGSRRDLADDFLDCLYDLGRIQFQMAGPRREQIVLSVCGRDAPTVQIERDGLRPRRADIETEDAHETLAQA